MLAVRQRMRRQLKRALERDRSSERYVERASVLLCPRREAWLLTVVALVAILDYVTTCAALELSGKVNVHEAGEPAGPWGRVDWGCSW